MAKEHKSLTTAPKSHILTSSLLQGAHMGHFTSSLLQPSGGHSSLEKKKKKTNKIFGLVLMILVPSSIYIVEKSKNQDLLSHIVKSEKVFLCWFI